MTQTNKPRFDVSAEIGPIARIPAGSDWDQEFTFYLPESQTAAAANSAVLATEDVVRFRMYDSTSTLITATDQAASANGTTVTIETRGVASTTPARITVDLDSDDTNQTAAVYQFIVDVQDDSDSSRWQPACHGLIEIIAGPP